MADPGYHDDFKIISKNKELKYPLMRLFAFGFSTLALGYFLGWIETSFRIISP